MIIPRSHRLDFFIFFSNTFLTLNVSDHTTVPQTGFKKTMVIDVQKGLKKNSAVCVRTRTVNVNTFSTTVKDEISEGW